MNGMDVDAVIVDLDGTMVDTLGDFAEALNRMLTELGLPPIAREAIEPRVGKGSEHLIQSVLAHVGAATAQYDRAFESYQRHYGVINGQFSTLYPGVVAGLEAFKSRGLPMVCLTNKPTALARHLLEAKGVDHFFGHVFGGDAFARKKPDPLPLLKACEALGTPTGRTLMVGDSSNDAQAGRAAGCPGVLGAYGYNHGEPLRAVGADRFVDSLAELA